LNYKKGLFRIWLIAACCWIGYTLYVKSDDVGYTYDYLFKKQQLIEVEQSRLRNEIKNLEEQGKELRAEPKIKDTNFWGRMAQDSGIADNITKKMQLEEILNLPIYIPEPHWDWAIEVTIVPTLLPALMFAAWWILSKIFLWIKKGFAA
jgi:hypothetical protein